MYILIIGWLYVVLMMTAAEAASPTGTMLGALITFVLYGVLPVSLMVYFIVRPGRKKAPTQEQPPSSATPDGCGEAPADAVPPVRKEG